MVEYGSIPDSVRPVAVATRTPDGRVQLYLESQGIGSSIVMTLLPGDEESRYLRF